MPAALQEAGAPASLDPLQPRLRELRTLGERCPADRRQLVATIKKALKRGVCLAAIMQKTSERNVLDECRRGPTRETRMSAAEYPDRDSHDWPHALNLVPVL